MLNKQQRKSIRTRHINPKPCGCIVGAVSDPEVNANDYTNWATTVKHVENIPHVRYAEPCLCSSSDGPPVNVTKSN